MKTYYGHRYDGNAVVFVQCDPCRGRIPLDPKPSQRIRNHSPDGFEWGYCGSGPAQLALALLLDAGVPTGDAERLYQTFKREIVNCLSDGWEITDEKILNWVKEQS